MARWSGIHTHRWAGAFWGIFLLVVCTLVGLQPDKRTVTHHYRLASERWWSSQDLYSEHNMHGFLYFPQAAWAYTPFILPPKVVGELLWRIVSIGSLIWAVWRLAKLIPAGSQTHLFFLLSMLTVPAILSSARNGQFNMPLASLMVHAAVCVAQSRWKLASLLLCLALILKPLALVPILLFGALIKPMRWPLIVGILCVALLPFVHMNQDYVKRQHQLCWNMLQVASDPDENNFCDLGGFLRTLGFTTEKKSMMLVRMLAALGTLGVCWMAFRRKLPTYWSIMLILGMSAAYLMVFNPRAETNSYVILSPILGAFALHQYFVDQRKREGWLLAIMAIALGCDSYGNPIHPMTNIWLKPLVAMLFMSYLSWKAFTQPQRSTN